MHGEIRAPFAHGELEFLDKEPLAADRRQRTIDDAIALRRHAEQFDRAARIKRLEPCAHVLRLPQRQCGLARRDHETAARMAVIDRSRVSGGAAAISRQGYWRR